MPSLIVVLEGYKVAEHRDLKFYAEVLTAGIFDVQESVISNSSRTIAGGKQ